MTDATPTAQLSEAGVSIWLDDLSRERIQSGGLQKLIDEKNVVGVTTNPTIFATALSKGEAYDEQVRELAKAGTGVVDAVFEITTDDVADASDIFHTIFEATNGVDGRVSIEVEPGLAHDAAGTIAEAKSWPRRSTSPTCSSRSRRRSRASRPSPRRSRRASVSTSR
jgi:Transaldolase